MPSAAAGHAADHTADQAARPATARQQAAAEPELDAAALALVRLVARVQAGDESAFAELYERTRARLRATVTPVLGSADLVDDVLQDTYLQVWRQCHQFQPGLGSVIGWMMTIARRRAIDRVRSLAGASRLQNRHVADPARSYDTDHQNAVTEAVYAEVMIRHALEALTRTEREALRLTYWDGRTTAEAARLLGIPVQTLKSRVHAATSRLRRLQRLQARTS